MTGSLQIRRGTYHCVLNFKDEMGKRKQKWINTKLEEKGNKKRAQQILNGLLAEHSDKDFYKANEILFVDYLKNSHDLLTRGIDKVTKSGYEYYLFSHMIPYFGPLRLHLKDVKPKHIVDYYNCKAKSGRIDNKEGGMGLEFLKKNASLLKKVLRQAQIEELIVRNPAEGVPLPKVEEKEQKNRKFLNVEEAKELLKAFRGHILQPIITITLYYGLRRSEVLGLRWDAMDFENETFEIKHVVTFAGNEIVCKDKTKNKSSHRTYKILPEVLTLLKELKAKGKEHQLLFGKEYENNGYVFRWEDGRVLRLDYLTKGFQKVLKQNGLPKMRFHDLRHSCASLLYDKKWQEKDVQEWLGHYNIQTTMNIYTHISESRKKIMAKDLEGLLDI